MISMDDDEVIVMHKEEEWAEGFPQIQEEVQQFRPFLILHNLQIHKEEEFLPFHKEEDRAINEEFDFGEERM